MLIPHSQVSIVLRVRVVTVAGRTAIKAILKLLTRKANSQKERVKSKKGNRWVVAVLSMTPM